MVFKLKHKLTTVQNTYKIYIHNYILQKFITFLTNIKAPFLMSNSILNYNKNRIPVILNTD